MKKLTLGIAALGLGASLAATAALPTGASPFAINIPTLKSGLIFNLTGLYLRPTNEDLDYASFTPKNAGSNNTTNIRIYSVKPDYAFGFHIGLGYVFPNSGNDVQVGWTHLNTSDSDSTHFKTDGEFGPIEIPNAFDSAVSTGGTASGDLRIKYNALDLDVGQYVNVGTRLTMRMFAGIRYASITRGLDQHFESVGSDGKVSGGGVTASKALDIDFHSDMHGVGPMFGMDSSYHVTNCFGFVGNVSTALLVSRIKNNTLYTLTDDSTPADVAKFALHSDTLDRVVPMVEGKLGADYSHVFNGSIFSIAAGYQVTHYFNAIDRIALQDTTNFEPGGGGSILRKTSSLGLDGPYLSLTLKVA